MDLKLYHPDRYKHLPSAIRHGTIDPEAGEIEFREVSVRSFKKRFPAPVLKAKVPPADKVEAR